MFILITLLYLFGLGKYDFQTKMREKMMICWTLQQQFDDSVFIVDSWLRLLLWWCQRCLWHQKIHVYTCFSLFPLFSGLVVTSYRDNGVKAIENLMQRRGKFDYILLETTGLADPGSSHYVFHNNNNYPGFMECVYSPVNLLSKK